MRVIPAATALCLSLAFAQECLATAPVHPAADPRHRIVDAAGLQLYAVNLVDAALNGQPGSIPGPAAARFAARHSAPAVNAVIGFERAYGVQSVGMTSWLGLSFAAYLTPSQVARIAENPLVSHLSEVSAIEFSATPPSPPWTDRTAIVPNGNSETYSWGHAAVNGTNLAAAPATGVQQPRVYIVDAGVGRHADLGPIRDVTVRPGISPVGCYQHATHVAGIIGATLRNGGVAGVLAGASLVSVPVSTTNLYNGSTACGAGADDFSIREAVDAVRADIGSSGQAAVVNISMNGGAFAPGNDLNTAIARLATPGFGYRGAFVANSAGNEHDGNPPQACWFAYSQNFAANAADGIMVVGGIDANGSMVVPPNGPTSFGYVNQPYAANEQGSNRGACVEVWAPSTRIWSTWGPLVGYDPANPSTYQLPSTTYSNYVQLGGTSMAAPFVAGIAAALLQQQPSLTPGQVESQVRSAMRTFGQTDASCVGDLGYACTIMLATNPVSSIMENPVATRLANVSTRGWVGTGNDVMIAGFSMSAGGKTVVLQGIGPSLAGSGVSNTLANPTLTLVRQRDGAVLAVNDNWQEAANWQQVQSLGFQPGSYWESAILITLPEPGAYTAILSGVGGGVGNALVAVYEIDRPDIEFTSLSTRGLVLTGDSVMIGGFIMQGSGPRTMVIRATGPTLWNYGITNPLWDPVLTLVPASGGPAITVNSWREAANWPELQTLGFQPGDTREAAFLINLDPGAYTAILSGVQGTTGDAIFELYPQ